MLTLNRGPERALAGVKTHQGGPGGGRGDAVPRCWLGGRPVTCRYIKRMPRRFGTVYSSPVVASGKLYLFSRQGGSLVLEAGDEYSLLSHNPPLDDSAVNSSPAVLGDRLLVRSDRYLYCIARD